MRHSYSLSSTSSHSSVALRNGSRLWCSSISSGTHGYSIGSFSFASDTDLASFFLRTRRLNELFRDDVFSSPSSGRSSFLPVSSSSSSAMAPPSSMPGSETAWPRCSRTSGFELRWTGCPVGALCWRCGTPVTEPCRRWVLSADMSVEFDRLMLIVSQVRLRVNFFCLRFDVDVDVGGSSRDRSAMLRSRELKRRFNMPGFGRFFSGDAGGGDGNDIARLTRCSSWADVTSL
ncbi:hypothetical protein NP493_732g01028 [Ridgeia piscesae]|uniref:Uncharacterized protein n=1 Tax=Ridgeia piscesae TaxID=27915 RepID=A0AAD9NMF4_RIDPI|nr:hypothetical protein NP493_732g01028 [Ridgeia piscesae]